MLIGYALISNSHYYKPQLVNLSNYAVLYESSILGGLIFVQMWIGFTALKLTTTECDLDEVMQNHACWFDLKLPYPLLDVLVASAGYALILGGLDRVINTPKKVARKLARNHGWMVNFVLDTLDEGGLVQITTVRGKVYVGWMQKGEGSFLIDGKIEDIAIVPLYSGHRSPESQVVTTDSNYSILIDQAIEGLSPRDREDEAKVNEALSEFGVVIPCEEIALMRRYSREKAAMMRERALGSP